MTGHTLPCRISCGLCTEEIGDEILVYDELRHKAFCLNATSAAIWKLCDGAHTVEQIAASVTFRLAMPVAEEVVLFALEELRRDNLVETEADVSTKPILSRRELMQKLGIGAAMLLPIIAPIVAPKAAQAYSGCVDC